VSRLRVRRREALEPVEWLGVSRAVAYDSLPDVTSNPLCRPGSFVARRARELGLTALELVEEARRHAAAALERGPGAPAHLEANTRRLIDRFDEWLARHS
jgi:hypothetical protein